LLDAGKHEGDEIIETLFQGDIQNYESHRSQAMALCNTDYGLLCMANIK
jgi:hypothetical protein